MYHLTGNPKDRFSQDFAEMFFNFFFSTIHGRIDQVNLVLELDRESVGTARYNALDKWTLQLQSLQQAVINKIA